MSEVARLKQQIETECEALRLAITGFRMAGSHDMINHQYDQLGEHYERLGKLIGEKEAIEILIVTLELTMDQKKKYDI
jgi:vacuolar-type H+-ATPase subunit F/Vma7